MVHIKWMPLTKKKTEIGTMIKRQQDEVQFLARRTRRRRRRVHLLSGLERITNEAAVIVSVQFLLFHPHTGDTHTLLLLYLFAVKVATFNTIFLLFRAASKFP